MSFSQNYLQLNPTSLVDKDDPEALPLVDLGPYGPDLYHYAVECKSLTIRWNDGRNETVLASNLKRPVWLVLDTGLTGCIFSDSLLEELQQLTSLCIGVVASSSSEELRGVAGPEARG